MLNVGDRVWVEVSRNKERLGTIISEDPSYTNRRHVDLDDGTGDLFPLNKLRPADKPNLTVATKYDDNKPRLELIPPSGIVAIGEAMTFGAKKYDDHNWAKGFKWSRLLGSAMRHLVSYIGGEDKDPESGLSHLAHAGACILMLIAHEVKGLGEDDRAKY